MIKIAVGLVIQVADDLGCIDILTGQSLAEGQPQYDQNDHCQIDQNLSAG